MILAINTESFLHISYDTVGPFIHPGLLTPASVFADPF
jgi:hypothetical protein